MAIAFLWVGLVFAWVGTLVIRYARSDFARAERVDGEVIGYVPNVDKDGTRTFCPVVSFVHPVAGRRVFESALGASYFVYSVGQKVTVLADLGDPARARVDSNAFLYVGLALAAIGFGCCALFFSIFRWGPFSVGAAAVVSLGLVWELRRKRESFGKLGELSGLLQKALAGSVVEEAGFDRGRLLPVEELASARRRQARQSLVGGVVLLALATGGLAGSWFWAKHRLVFVNRAVPAEGRVVALEPSSGSGSTTWAPVVEFTPEHASSPVRFRHSVSTSHPSWRVGQRVEVLYDPLDPSRAMINQGWWTIAVPLLPGACGLVFGLLGLVSLKAALTAG